MSWCLNDFINNDSTERYLLIAINPSLSLLLYKYIINQNPNRIIKYYDINFLDDNINTDYLLNKINQLQLEANNNKTEQIIILNNINKIKTFFYNIDNDSFNFNGELISKNRLKFIIFVDSKFMKNVDKSFLSRFEKIKLSFNNLMDIDNTFLTKKILEEINFENNIKQNNKIIYEQNDLILSLSEEVIEGLVYNIYSSFLSKGKLIKENEIKEEVYSKLAKISSKSFIESLPDCHVIKKAFSAEKRYDNLEEYIIDDKNKKYKISIIYTFSSISGIIEGINNQMKFFISEINTETELKNIIDEIIYKNVNIPKSNKLDINIIINFDYYNLHKIQYITYYIYKNLRKGKYEKYRFILLIHLKENIYNEHNKQVYTIIDINDYIDQILIEYLNSSGDNNKRIFNFDEKKVCCIENNENKNG